MITGDHAIPPQVVSLDGQWLLAPDAEDAGRAESWWRGPRPDARPTPVPWILQAVFPGYHGVAWYWREFEAPANPHPGGRLLLRLWAVDYKASVWVNGVLVGEHEGAESPFLLDVADAVRPGATNRLAVRVVNPTHEPIDGLVLNEIPHRNKIVPYTGAGSAWDQGGIWDSVELLVVPAVRIDDLFLRPDPKTGVIRAQVTAYHAGPAPVRARLDLTVAPAAAGATVDAATVVCDLPLGASTVEAEVRVRGPRLWWLSDPYLYRVTARLSAVGSASFDEQSARFGFRDFRFEDGYFRLNGRRLHLRCSHTGNCCPIGLEMPPDPDMLRRDLVLVKAMGFNAIRFIAGVAKRYQLDLCDELGLMVWEEAYASWCLADSPKMGERYDESLLGMVKRDRNHPSVVIWGLLNETPDGPVFRHAAALLPRLRALDDTRMVMLNSGRWDLQAPADLAGRESTVAADQHGTLSNPGSDRWEPVLADEHPYRRVPHTADVLHFFRTCDGGELPLLISEYGIGSAVDLWRTVRHYEEAGAADLDDARFYRDKLDRFLADWQRWHLAEVFGRPEDYFRACLAKMAGQRLLGLNAIRANPAVVGHSLTGTVDQGMTGEGLFTTWRELKPGTIDAMSDAWAPLRWCLFAEPANVYRGARVRLEAVLADEDALAPGEYPARLQVFRCGAEAGAVFDRRLTVTIPERADGSPEPPFALPVFSEDVPMDVPAGHYRFVATFESGAAAAGGEAEFYVTDPAEMPRVDADVTLWGSDPGLAEWLAAYGIPYRPFAPATQTRREVILASGAAPAPGGAEVFVDLARRIARGSAVIFLTPALFAADDNPVAWLPLAEKGSFGDIPSWLYLKDEWARRHPILDGLPAGGLMDYTFYRELIPDAVFSGQEPPAEAVAGAIKTSQDYSSGLTVAVYPLGAGRLILNSLLVRDNLGTHPAAERLLRNLLLYAARDLGQPLAALPANFDGQLKAFGYR